MGQHNRVVKMSELTCVKKSSKMAKLTRVQGSVKIMGCLWTKLIYASAHIFDNFPYCVMHRTVLQISIASLSIGLVG